LLFLLHTAVTAINSRWPVMRLEAHFVTPEVQTVKVKQLSYFLNPSPTLVV